jgi:DNA-binding transcriptional LysR family regulator
MIKDGFDLTIRITHKLEGSLIARRVAPSHHALVAASSYLARHGIPQAHEDLTTHNVIIYQQSQRQWESTAAKSKHKPKRTILNGSVK